MNLSPVDVAHAVRVLAGAGVVRPIRPDLIPRIARIVNRWGFTPGAAIAVAAMRLPREPAVIDDDGVVTFAEMHERTSAIASALGTAGVGEGDTLALLCRNHRGFVEAAITASKLGARALLLNTGFAAPQLRDVMDAEGARTIVYDAEFAPIVDAAGGAWRRVVSDAQRASRDVMSLGALAAAGDPEDLAPPTRPGGVVLLTSGTTGRPKGAGRPQFGTLDAAVTLLSVMPLRTRERTVVAAPLFHTWGFAHFALGLMLCSTQVLRRRFDPETTLRVVADNGASALVVVPVMLSRILDLPDRQTWRYDVSSLRVVAASGSALAPSVATRFMDRFGDVLYNVYGSTEVAWATAASPADLRAAPGTVGRPPRGTQVRLVDGSGQQVPLGGTGRIFVGNEMSFTGYTSGEDKERLGGLVSTGDVGHWDDAGLLFVDGRDDDMIVSGGENVFPAEVEDCLAAHPSVREAAVVGMPDEEFGQRLRAYVVADSPAPTEDDLRAHVRDTLARHKVPRDVVFLDELPRNATGKVLKLELR